MPHRVASGQQRRAGRAAHRLSVEGVEPGTGGGQSVQMRCADHLAAHEPAVFASKVVSEDEHDIRPIHGASERRQGKADQDEKNEDGSRPGAPPGVRPLRATVRGCSETSDKSRTRRVRKNRRLDPGRSGRLREAVRPNHRGYSRTWNLSARSRPDRSGTVFTCASRGIRVIVLIRGRMCSTPRWGGFRKAVARRVAT